MIDVSDKIKDLLRFEKEDDFYYLQILQRKKENPDIGSNSKVIKNYHISSWEYLEIKYDEIKQICNLFNARAMLRLNKRSFRKVAFKALQNMANTMANSEYDHVKNAYDRACGEGQNDANKTWILDIDGEIKPEYLQNLLNYISFYQPEGDKLVVELPTKNGIHLVTKPFDLRNFKQDYPEIEVHKDNPINLYVP